MKKKFLILLAIMLFISPLSAYASASDSASTIEYLDDGTYFETVIEDVSSYTNRAANQTTKSKTVYYRTVSHEVMWYVKVTGTFTYNGQSAKCLSSKVTAVSENKSWKIYSKDSSYSANKASATATAKQYYGINVLQTVKKSVTLTCSATGEFS